MEVGRILALTNGWFLFLDVYVSFVMICIPLRKVRWRHLPDDGIRALSERAFGRLSLADLA